MSPDQPDRADRRPRRPQHGRPHRRPSTPRPTPAPRTERLGERFEVVCGPVAHGGHVVARHEGQVVFVRHALPGERVVVAVTEDSGKFLRADAVEVLEPSADRVEPPCPLAVPDGCGGCDFQHATPASQRLLKAEVVREQLQRLAGLEREVVVEPVPGDQDGLRWRTRMQYVALPDGGRGLRKHRSHEVVEVLDCKIARDDARVVLEPAVPPGPTSRSVDGPPVVEVVESVLGTRRFEVAGDGFWQVHPGAPRVLVETLMSMLAPRPGERVLDLYGGVGLFSAYLAEAVGDTGTVTLVEADGVAAGHAATNLDDLPAVEVVQGKVDAALRAWRGSPTDLVVLDPPRTGAKKTVVTGIADLGPRAVAYVACDPAALARDLAYFADAGYRLADLRALDLFPMTHHVECVALLVPTLA